MAFSADPTFLGLLSIAIGVFMGLVSIAIAIYFGVRPTLRKLEKDVSEIKTNTEPIKRIEETTRRMDEKTTRLDERIDTFLKIIPGKAGTVELMLKNLGKVTVSAEPYANETRYIIKTEKPVLKGGFIAKVSKETGLTEKEKELFGGKTPRIIFSAPDTLILVVPSSDPKICREYMSIFLKWLDTRYWEALEQIKEYEKITV